MIKARGRPNQSSSCISCLKCSEKPKAQRNTIFCARWNVYWSGVSGRIFTRGKLFLISSHNKRQTRAKKVHPTFIKPVFILIWLFIAPGLFFSSGRYIICAYEHTFKVAKSNFPVWGKWKTIWMWLKYCTRCQKKPLHSRSETSRTRL